jgi:hypothetical protein
MCMHCAAYTLVVCCPAPLTCMLQDGSCVGAEAVIPLHAHAHAAQQRGVTQGRLRRAQLVRLLVGVGRRRSWHGWQEQPPLGAAGVHPGGRQHRQAAERRVQELGRGAAAGGDAQVRADGDGTTRVLAGGWQVLHDGGTTPAQLVQQGAGGVTSDRHQHPQAGKRLPADLVVATEKAGVAIAVCACCCCCCACCCCCSSCSWGVGVRALVRADSPPGAALHSQRHGTHARCGRCCRG